MRTTLVLFASLWMSPIALGNASAADSVLRQLAERGPGTLLVGALFTLSAPPAALLTPITGGDAANHACRLGHGVKMFGAGLVLAPAGILASPANLSGAAGGWVDSLTDALQEDYCTRPISTVYP